MKASFTAIQKNFQMLIYWNKQLTDWKSLQIYSQMKQQTSTVLNVRNTTYDMNVFQNFLSEVGEERKCSTL